MAANQSTTRIFNMREIINALMKEGELSRAGLAKMLGLSKPATAENVEKLISLGLVMEIGEGAANRKGGRKPRLLTFNKLFRTIVAIDLSLPHPVLAIGNLQGELLAKTKLGITADTKDNNEKILAILSAIRLLMQTARCPKNTLGIIVMSAPGIFKEDNSLLYANPQFRGWTDIGLDAAMAKEFSVPVLVKNDMFAAALGEFSLGYGKGCRNLVYASCGMGLGAGLIIDGKLYQGKDFAAGEICSIIDRQSFEAGSTIQERVSIGTLLQSVEADIAQGAASALICQLAEQSGKLAFSHIVEAGQKRDGYIIGKMKDIGQELGFLFTNISALLDAEYIVMGGEYLAFFDDLKVEIEAVLSKCAPVPPALVASVLGEEAGLYGAIVHGRDQLFLKLAL